ncbi:MAG: SAM-dependent methyltransferase, partial [Chloroflexi bacterium]
RWLGFERDEVRAWYLAAGLTDVVVDCAEGDCCTTAPNGEALALRIFVAYGLKP